MKIKHIITTRLCRSDFLKDGRVFEEKYVYDSIGIMQNNFIRTLENQTNKNFEILVLCNPKNDDKKFLYEKLETKLDIKFMSAGTFEYVNSFFDEYDFIINTTLDTDDFLHKDCVEMIQKCVRDNTTFKMYGFVNGATIVQGEHTAYKFEKEYLGKTGFMSCGTSIIYSTKLNFTKEFPYFIYSVAKKYNGKHTNWKNIILSEYKNWGLEYLDEDFFDYTNDDKIRFIWVRQPMSFSTIKLNKDNSKLHFSNVSKEINLLDDFGYMY